MRIFSKKPKEIINASMRRQNVLVFQLRFYNHYETLGITPSATQQDIKTAFIQLSKKLHPDINKEDPKAHEKFVAVNNAYGVLCKPSTRKQYDLKSGIAYSSSSRPHYHYPRYGQRDVYNEDWNHFRSSWFDKFTSNYMLRCKLHFFLRALGVTPCVAIGVLQWVSKNQKLANRKKKQQETISFDYTPVSHRPTG